MRGGSTDSSARRNDSDMDKTAGITLESPQEAGLLIASLAMAEAANCADEAAASLTLTLAANLVAEIDPTQEILKKLAAKAVLAANAIKPFHGAKAQEAFARLVGRVQRDR